MSAPVEIENLDGPYELIRRSLIEGLFSPGERLVESELAAQFGVSRTPVREALRRLHAEGFVTFAANKGAQVVSWTPYEVDQLYEFRAIMESYAARLACASLDSESIAKLEELTDLMDAIVIEQGDAYLDKVYRLNEEFHQIVRLAGSGPLQRSLKTLEYLPMMHRVTLRQYSARELTRSLQHHRELVEAFLARDPDWADAIMKSHVLAARNALRRAEAPFP